MDLRKALLKEHSKARTNQIADYVGNNEAIFKELVDVYLAGPYRITQRASWPLSICVERHPGLVKPYLNKILKHLYEPSIHDAVKRNTMRLLQFVEIPRAYHGRVAELCFNYLTDKKEPVAVKAFSMTVLAQITKAEPELKRELKMVIEDQLPYSSPGFIVRANKILKMLSG